jgi:hypothetical protein
VILRFYQTIIVFIDAPWPLGSSDDFYRESFDHSSCLNRRLSVWECSGDGHGMELDRFEVRQGGFIGWH